MTLPLRDQAILTGNALKNMVADMEECARDVPERYKRSLLEHSEALTKSALVETAPAPNPQSSVGGGHNTDGVSGR